MKAKKLPIQEQIKYAMLAQDLADTESIPFKAAAKTIIEEHKLPIAVKTLSNLNGVISAVSQYLKGDEIQKLNDINAALRRENIAIRKKMNYIQAKEEDIIESTKDAIKVLPEIPIPNIIVKKPKNKEVAMLDISDVHMGANYKSEDTAGLSVYNGEVFKKECNTLIEKIYSIIDIQRKGGVSVDTLYINMLGDLIENEIIYPAQGFFIDRVVFDQIFELGDYFSHNVLAPLGKLFKNVIILTVQGNHARGSSDKKQGHRRTNFDDILVKFWEKEFSQNERYKFIISKSKFMIYEIFETKQKHLLAHGDEVRSFMNIPFYGMLRYYSRMISLSNMYIDFVHLGHHHTNINMDINYGHLLANGSWVGGSPLSVDKLQAANQPAQNFYGVNKDRMTWYYNLYLREKETLLSDNWVKTPTY